MSQSYPRVDFPNNEWRPIIAWARNRQAIAYIAHQGTVFWLLLRRPVIRSLPDRPYPQPHHGREKIHRVA